MYKLSTKLKCNNILYSSVVINGTTVKSRATKEDFVEAVNDEVTNAKIDIDGFVVLSNTDGDKLPLVVVDWQSSVLQTMYMVDLLN